MANYVAIIACLALSVICLTEAQDQPKCVRDMMQKPGFVECFQGFMGFIKNAARSSGAGGPDPKDMIKVMCSTQGKSAIRCMMPFIKDCPQITQQSGGMDLGAFMQGGGMDAACALMAGPCVKVVECMQKVSQAEAGGDMKSMASKDMNSNPFAAFLTQTSMACSNMKAQFECTQEHEAECGDEIKQLEDQVRRSMDVSLKDSNTAFHSYDDMKAFMKEQCAAMPTKDKESAKSCVMGALSTPEFLNCYQNATDTYTMKNEGQCSLYDMHTGCLEKTVGPKCGEENTKFMQRNMNLVIKTVPVSCTLTDTSGAIRNMQLTSTTLVILALSSFLIF